MKRPRILFVAMSDSIHTARWINQLADTGWDVHLFASTAGGVHPALKNVTVHNLGRKRQSGLDRSVRIVGVWPWHRLSDVPFRLLRPLIPAWLALVIRWLKPDIVHSLEIQHAGYLTFAAREYLKGRFPTWIVTCWGNDLYFFGRLTEHIERIKGVLAACDYYSADCQRDILLAQEIGLRGITLPVWPGGGGFAMQPAARWSVVPTSRRRLILLKGYQGWAGRALVGLHAIALCADDLKDYRIAVYLADDDVKRYSQHVTETTGLPVEIISRCSHDAMLQLMGQARVHLAVSVSDGLPNALIEAMLMGAFPIQSCTSCADEVLINGETGILVHPDDDVPIANALRRALTDDALVDRAAKENMRVVRERFSNTLIRPEVIRMYEGIMVQPHLRSETRTHA